MDNKKIKKYERITKITGILIGLILILGTSYAVFRTVTRSEESNTISAGKLYVRIENEQEEITIEKAYPITEKEGLKQSPYTFDIVNKGTINAEYELYIEIEENTTLPTEVVRYYLTVEEEQEEKIVTEQARLISQEEKIEREGKSLYKIDTKYLDTTKTNKYKLYLWIDYEATTEQASNKYFEAKVVVDSVQIYDKNRLVKQIDVSESGDNSVLAYMYADGTVYIKGKGTMVSDLSDTLVYEKEGIVENYKKLLIEAGCNEEEVSAITSMKEIEAYVEDQANNDESLYEKIEIAQNKEIITEMGYDASSITDYESLYAWLIEQGIMDEEGRYTEEGKILFEEFELRINEKYDYEPTPATKIVLEDGIENIPIGLFTYNEEITEVRIPASVKRIDDRAFAGCRGLKEITIPISVTSIGDSAFQYCTSLTNITIPNSVTSIGAYAFEYCNSLSTINIEGNNLIISYSAFRYCSKLNTVHMKGVVSIGVAAFQYCTSLTNITIPNSVTSIGSSAFYNCTSLTTIELPNSVTSIGDSAFAYCSSLSTMNIEGNNLIIDNSAFRECTKLNTVNMKGVSSIGTYAFYNCTSLTNITIPNSVTSIGNYAFERCTGIKKLTIDGTKNYGDLRISTIEELVITGTGNMYNYSSSSNVPWNSSRSSIKKVTINDTLTSIESTAFYNCRSLTTIEIPNSVTSIGASAFSGCTGIKKLTIDGTKNCGDLKISTIEELVITGTGNMYDYSSYDNVPWNSSKSSIKKITINDTLTSIGSTAFYNCRSLTTIEIPNSVTSIGITAFGGCTSLTNIIIPDSVTSIGSSAFQSCTSLTSITIPKSVTSIGGYAFSYCTNIKEITIPNSVEYVGSWTFWGWTSSQIVNIDNTESYVNANWDSSWKYGNPTVNYLRS